MSYCRISRSNADVFSSEQQPSTEALDISLTMCIYSQLVCALHIHVITFKVGAVCTALAMNLTILYRDL